MFVTRLPFTSNTDASSDDLVSTSDHSKQTSKRTCCENGRPVFTDPTTGQSLCSCEYNSALLGYTSRLPGLPGSLFAHASPYNAGPIPSTGYAVGFGTTDTSTFYSPLSAGSCGLRDSTEAWRSLTQTSLGETTAAMGFYPYASYGGLDLNTRRKNATRESTNTLKAWLGEHMKNPYPTKGEKIMLAIITKMTLTQVSTWFANARRRLKKENKMTWSPRNRSEDGGDDDDEKMGNVSIIRKSSENGTADYTDATRFGSENGTTHNSRSSSSAESPRIESSERLSPTSILRQDSADFNFSPTSLEENGNGSDKPKIWSVMDVLNVNSSKASRPSCKETGMKMDVMRCVPTSKEAMAVDLTDKTTGIRVLGPSSNTLTALPLPASFRQSLDPCFHSVLPRYAAHHAFKANNVNPLFGRVVSPGTDNVRRSATSMPRVKFRPYSDSR